MPVSGSHSNVPSSNSSSAVSQKSFLRKYIFSTDHKIIGLQFYYLALAAVLVGMLLSLLMRIHLIWPDAHIPLFGEIKPDTYLALVTMHGTIMIFFVLTTAPQAAFGNFFLPLQIGAREMAFPRLNMLSFWLTLTAFLVMLSAFFVAGGAPLHGWTAYPPLSAVQSAGVGEAAGADLWLLSIALFCVASVLSAVDIIATTLDARAPGLSLMRLPLTVWAWFITAILSLLAFGVLFSAAILLLLDRHAGTSFFVPLIVVNGQLAAHKGGSPLLWQHLFWFFGHPEVYIAILPGMGLASQVLSVFSRKPVFGYKAMVYAMLSIGFLGFMVWGHHMFVSGMSPYASFAFALMTMAIAVPSAIKTFNWLGTLWRGKIRFSSPMLFAIGFVSFFVSGGISGPFLAQPALDIQLHDTYFVVAHFHLIMGMAAIFGIFTGTHYWFPKMFGRLMNEPLARVHFFLTLFGAYAIFMPMHYLGLAGNPRRYSQLTELKYLHGLIPLQTFITYAAIITIAAQFIFLFNFFWSLRRGKRAEDNPWQATTLEWTVASPAPYDNFGALSPIIVTGPYEYSVPGAPRDFLMQNEPFPAIAPTEAPTNLPTRESTPANYLAAAPPTFAIRLRRARLGLVIALVAISMIFVSYSSAYVVRRGLPTLDSSSATLVHDWLPIHYPNLLYVNLTFLLLSAFAIGAARRHAKRQALLAATDSPSRPASAIVPRTPATIPWDGLAFSLGLTFLFGQSVLWRKLAAGGLLPATNPSASFFYLLSGMHALFFIAALLALFAASVSLRSRSSAESSLILRDITASYWHFLVFLWICVFCLLEYVR